VIELLKSYFEITDEDDDSHRSEKVEAQARALDPVLAETLPYTLSLLGIAGATRDDGRSDKTPAHGGGSEAHHHPRDLKQPLVVIFENLHWIDAETQEFLDLVRATLSRLLFSDSLLFLIARPPAETPEFAGAGHRGR